MAFDAFLKIDGIPGESTDDKHKDWIEILSYSSSLNQPVSGSSSSGGARSAERCSHSDFSLVKTLDKASPKLALHCCNGKHIKEVKLELCRATGDKQVYMQYVLGDVIVSSYSPGGSAQGGDTLPVESVSFNYGKIEWVYTATNHETGKPEGDVKATWSVVENKGS